MQLLLQGGLSHYSSSSSSSSHCGPCRAGRMRPGQRLFTQQQHHVMTSHHCKQSRGGSEATSPMACWCVRVTTQHPGGSGGKYLNWNPPQFWWAKAPEEQLDRALTRFGAEASVTTGTRTFSKETLNLFILIRTHSIKERLHKRALTVVTWPLRACLQTSTSWRCL